MLSVRQVSEQTGISARQVLALIHARRLRALNLSRSPASAPRYKIVPADLDRFLKEAATDSQPATILAYPGRGRPRRRAASKAPATEAVAFLDQMLAKRQGGSVGRGRKTDA